MLEKTLSLEKFSTMFFEVSAKLSNERKKMKYRDWMDMREIAIEKKKCCSKGLTLLIGNEVIRIICPHCYVELLTVYHQDTALEIKEYFEKKELSSTSTSLDITGIKVYNNNIVMKNTNECLTVNNNINKKENENMMNTNKMFKGLDFGKANKDLFRLSHLGLAVKNSEGTFVSYDKNNKNLVDVDLFDFDLDGMIYKMPVAHNQVAIGDVIIHNGNPVLVKDALVNSDNLEVIDPVAGEIKTIMPTKNMFGFNFFTKILCLMDMNNLGASTDNPFGNMMPFMMMSAMKDGDGGNNNMMTMMMMSQMMGGNNSMGDMFSNPMMMMAMMSGDGKMGDMLPMMMMMMQGGMFKPSSPNCGGNCSCDKSF